MQRPTPRLLQASARNATCSKVKERLPAAPSVSVRGAMNGLGCSKAIRKILTERGHKGDWSSLRSVFLNAGGLGWPTLIEQNLGSPVVPFLTHFLVGRVPLLKWTAVEDLETCGSHQRIETACVFAALLGSLMKTRGGSARVSGRRAVGNLGLSYFHLVENIFFNFPLWI